MAAHLPETHSGARWQCRLLSRRLEKRVTRMLQRQRVLLHMLESLREPASTEQLTLLAFLVRTETATGGGNAFYDFIGQPDGPISFCLSREIARLQQSGHATQDDGWRVAADGNDRPPSPPGPVRRDVEHILHAHAGKDEHQIRKVIRKRHPAYFLRATAPHRIQAPVPAVYTAGYEGLSVDAFLNRLLDHGMERLIDVRSNPIARRFGFHRSTLSRLLGKVGIDYVHIPELGIESSQRRHLESPDDYENLFLSYEEQTLERESASVNRVARLMREAPGVLVCMEANPASCHRTRLARAVARKTRLPILDLGQLRNGESTHPNADTHHRDDVSSSIEEV
ncbi:hypothetical protein Mal4_57130 [Maioricimonas rarisocia]|uniref:DUF488 domain-containing protein n=1 Tax=Maioricimonas rarisocia TaxID=2528026 RepID=A0A517ZFT7_9PLAN|nr:DUF488 domain-containing protein [Maioricimonas rarisocia]QDU41347.1 hypothetical protein Mal4_57130 [Maioricimonas rarisocia]